MKRRASSVLGSAKNVSAAPLSITRPRCMSTISPARRLASPRSCVDITTLIPRAATTRMTSSIALVAAGSRLAVGSSSRRILRLLGERARERDPLLLATGELSRQPAAKPGKADDSGELVDAGSALRARHAGGRERITDVAGGAATEHRRALEHDGAMRRLGGLAASPGHAAAHGRNQAHDQAQQRGLACAVRSDQHGGRASR